MSTYTDLHNRVKENLVVGYRPDDRVTTQKVKFYNEENEYWGTFKGNFDAEKINANGGTISNAKIINVELSNVSWPGGIEFDKFGTLLEILSSNVGEIQSTFIPDIFSKIYQEATARATADAHLDERISSLGAYFDARVSSVVKTLARELSTLNLVTREYVSELSTTLSTEFDEKIVNLSTVFDGKISSLEDIVAENSISTISALLTLQAYVDTKANQLCAATRELSDAIDVLRVDLGSEVYDRTVADTKLDNKINSLSATSDRNDAQLSAYVDAFKAENSQQHDEIVKDAADSLEAQRHYSIFAGSQTTEAFPYEIRDFAVNVYKPVLPGARVYWKDNELNRIDVGELTAVQNPETGNIDSATLTIYSNISNDGIASALIEGNAYDFTATEKTVPTGANGYSIYFNDTATDKNLSSFFFTLKSITSAFHKVRLDGVYAGIRAYDTDPEGACSSIQSGKLYIDAVDSSLTTFNKFNKSTFNTESLSVLDKETERITYLGDNTFEFKKNIDVSQFIQLRDTLSSDAVAFGRVYRVVDGVSGVVIDDGQIAEMTVNLSKPYITSTKLLSSAGFNSTVSADLPEDDRTYNIILSADVDGVSAAFDVVKVSEQYKYPVYGVNDAGETEITGYVIPHMFNKTMNESKDFNVVSVDISRLIWIDEFENLSVVPMTRVAGSASQWTYTATDSNHNVLLLTFNGVQFIAKVTSSTDGQVVKQIYSVDASDSSIYNLDTCHKHLYKTVSIDMSKFDEYVEIPAATYIMKIDEAESTESYDRYDLAIDTSNVNVLQLCIPKRTSANISREFIIVMKVDAPEDKLVELKFVDADGSPVSMFNEDKNDLFIETNKWAMLQFNELRTNDFLVVDLADREEAHYFKVLKQMIEKETADRTDADEALSIGLSNEIDVLSAKLSGEIDTLSASLSADIVELSIAISTDVNSLSAALSGEIDDLAEDTALSISSLQNQVLSNDDDIEFLSSIADALLDADKKNVNYKGTVPQMTYPGEPTDHLKLSAFLNQNVSGSLKIGDLFRLSAAQSNADCLWDADNLSTYLGEKDFIIVNKDVEDIAAVKVGDLDIFRNAETEVEKLSAELKADVSFISSEVTALSNGISIEVSNLSTELSTAIDSLSGKISAEVEALSTSLSSTIKTEVFYLSADNVATGTNVFEGITNAAKLSVADLTVSSLENVKIADNSMSSVQNMLDLSVSNINDAVSAVDGRCDELSDSISAVSAFANDIDADLSSLEKHYTDNLSNDITLEHTYVDGEGHTRTISAAVDQLVMVDEVTFKRYRLTVRNGSLNINLIDDLAV